MAAKEFTLLPDFIKDGFVKLIDFPVDFAIKFNAHPNLFTVLSLITCSISAYYYAISDLLLGGILIWVGGIFDLFDGKIARKTDQSTKFGAVFDSTVDRYAEFFMFLGIMIYLQNIGDQITLIAAFFAMIGSVMVSYVRARSESIGIECKVGMMPRAERIVTIGFASVFAALFHPDFLVYGIWIVAIFANITALQRLFNAWGADEN